MGLTGPVASGKSRVAGLLAELGAVVRDADIVVEELYAGGAGARAVRDLFGASVIGPDGAVDRRALGRVVLAEGTARQRLEAAIHPLVRAELARWLDGLESTTAAPTVAVVEAALLVETGAYRDYHRLLVVRAPLAVRRQRALDAGWSAETFDRIAAVQASDEARAAAADYVVDNSSDAAALAAATARVWQQLVGDAAALASGSLVRGQGVELRRERSLRR